jgi:hypothetical protein
MRHQNAAAGASERFSITSLRATPDTLRYRLRKILMTVLGLVHQTRLACEHPMLGKLDPTSSVNLLLSASCLRKVLSFRMGC